MRLQKGSAARHLESHGMERFGNPSFTVMTLFSWLQILIGIIYLYICAIVSQSVLNDTSGP